jgi:glutamine phosphoribosylpyrophosphate amidotransferase
MDLGQFSTEKLVAKRREAADIKSFLIEDSLQFQYPPGLVQTVQEAPPKMVAYAR